MSLCFLYWCVWANCRKFYFSIVWGCNIYVVCCKSCKFTLANSLLINIFGYPALFTCGFFNSRLQIFKPAERVLECRYSAKRANMQASSRQGNLWSSCCSSLCLWHCYHIWKTKILSLWAVHIVCNLMDVQYFVGFFFSEFFSLIQYSSVPVFSGFNWSFAFYLILDINRQNYNRAAFLLVDDG